MAITDRLRWTVIEANTNRILTRDLIVKDAQVARYLSAPAQVQFNVSQGESSASSAGIPWQEWRQIIVSELEVDGVQQIFTCSIVEDVKINPQNGDMQIQSTGFMGYGKGIPWLQDFNPIAVDPFELIQRIWAHLQSYSNANLEVQALPASSETQMLPGYAYDGSSLTFNFFAVFIRQVDFNDCNDYMTALARDIPFDMVEKAEWNADRTKVIKTVQMGYPLGGVQQDYLTFRVGENVISATQTDTMDIQKITDVIIRGWLPGKVISSELFNSDPTCLRRTVMEEDVYLESDERAAAWAKRKLTRRNIPNSFKQIVIDPNHPNAPGGHFDVGDSIFIEAQNYPWLGDVAQWHRIIGIAYDDSKRLMKLDTKVDGAFNYDPIIYDPNYINQPIADPNRIANGYFAQNLSGWTAVKGEWFRVTEVIYQTQYNFDSGSVRVDCDDQGDEFLSHVVSVTPGEHLSIQCAVQFANVVSTGVAQSFVLRGTTSNNGDKTVGHTYDFDSVDNAQGAGGWHLLQNLDWVVPSGINELAIHFVVTANVTAGSAWWTYARVFPTGKGGPTP